MPFEKARTYSEFGHGIGNVGNAKFRPKISSSRTGENPTAIGRSVNNASINLSKEHSADIEGQFV